MAITMQTYRGMLLNPTRILRNILDVGGLTEEDRMLVYIIIYILSPISNNHTQVIDDNLQIIYGLKSSIQMNWVLLIEDIMLKSRRLMDYEFPYVVDFTKGSNEITERHLKKLGMTYVDHEWIMVRDQPAATNNNQMEEEA